MENYDLDRFKQAQNGQYGGYLQALAEVRRGCKSSHWMWYIFPQLRGLGRSPISNHYGIAGLAEARAYLDDSVLGGRLREICQALLIHNGKPPEDVFGDIDSRKLKSCMTLFDYVSPDDLFGEVLENFYHGRRDQRTIRMLESRKG